MKRTTVRKHSRNVSGTDQLKRDGSNQGSDKEQKAPVQIRYIKLYIYI